MSLVQREYDKSVDSVVTELNLKTEARSFISKCVSEGRVITAGNALDDILPPMRRFGSGARHGEIREKSVEAIRKIVEEYCGLLALPNGVAGF